jgi:hypothetical protein
MRLGVVPTQVVCTREAGGRSPSAGVGSSAIVGVDEPGEPRSLVPFEAWAREGPLSLPGPDEVLTRT